MNDAPVQHVAGHVIALDFQGVAPAFLVSVVPIEPPEITLATLGAPPVGRNARIAGTGECMQLAVMMLDQATCRDPGVLERDGAELDDMLTLLWPAIRRLLAGLARSPKANELTRLLDQEARWRCEEMLIPVRDAARARAAEGVRHLLRSLVAIAAEADPTTRAAALAAIAPEIRRALGAP